jgi:hypothetical protein
MKEVTPQSPALMARFSKPVVAMGCDKSCNWLVKKYDFDEVIQTTSDCVRALYR